MFFDRIFKHSLANGLTALIVPRHHIPKVSIQLWYNVGSKNESTHQKGIAHFIEHMIFKGTKTRSESDINLTTKKLSGYCNAFTSHDYTGYLFDFPSQQWKEALSIMADCMQNCTFKKEFLQSELKAVIQELKLYNDEYASSLIERMMCAIFYDHPYRYPIIGYKQDLWRLSRKDLLKFYAAHYLSNNATLVIVGDVDPDDALLAVEKEFAHLQSNPYKKPTFYHAHDLLSTNTTIYRDIQQPLVVLAWVIPGIQARQDYIVELVSWIVGAGKGSRLYSKIVEELSLAYSIESFVYDLFEHALLIVQFQPKSTVSIDSVVHAILQELDNIAQHGCTQQELSRAIKKSEMDILALREDNQKLAYLIGKYYLANGDENYLGYYNNIDPATLPSLIQNMLKKYVRPCLMHRGEVLPMPAQEKASWLEQQQCSDEEDSLVLSNIMRTSLIEDGSYVKNIAIAPPKQFSFPQAHEFTLSNGLKVLHCDMQTVPKINVILDFKAKHFFDPENLQGLSSCLFDMLQEGTKQHNATQFAAELEQFGMSLDTAPGNITMSMLSSDTRTGFRLLADVVTQASLHQDALEKVKARTITDCVDFWDDPSQFSNQLMREKIYGQHPFHKRVLGSTTSVSDITIEDITEAYKNWITPKGSVLVVVGAIDTAGLRTILEDTLANWEGPAVDDLAFPPIEPCMQSCEINYPINRDQITLCFGKLSISRKDPDFDKIHLFDQVLTGGVLGSLSSKLFALREKSGLFYTIGGSLTAGAGRQPGMMLIKTLVSQDRLKEAECCIKAVINEGATSLTNDELDEAKQGLINSLVDYFSSNEQTASTLLFIERLGFPKDYFNTRAQNLLNIDLTAVKQANQQLLKTNNLITARIGRVKA